MDHAIRRFDAGHPGLCAPSGLKDAIPLGRPMMLLAVPVLLLVAFGATSGPGECGASGIDSAALLEGLGAAA